LNQEVSDVWATGHALASAAISAAVLQTTGNSVLAVVTPLPIHYLIDAGPQTAEEEGNRPAWFNQAVRGRLTRFHLVGICDLLTGGLLVLLLTMTNSDRWIIWAGAAVGILPDFLREGKMLANLPIIIQLNRFHDWIHHLWPLSIKSALLWIWWVGFITVTIVCLVLL